MDSELEGQMRCRIGGMQDKMFTCRRDAGHDLYRTRCMQDSTDAGSDGS